MKTVSQRSLMGTPIRHDDVTEDEPVVNVVLAMYGTESGMVTEMEVLFKSLLLNSPSHSDAKVNIYIMTNQEAFDNIGPLLFHRMGIPYSSHNGTNSTISQAPSSAPLTWWLPFHVYVINVQTFGQGWMNEVDGLRLRRNETLSLSVNNVHTEGSFYRIFAHRVLPNHVKHFFYSDSDVVLLADISALWELTRTSPPEVVFHWNWPGNSGFMLIKNTAELWDLMTQVDLLQLNKTIFYDQDLIQLVQWNYPNQTRYLPDEWNFALEWGFRHIRNLHEVRPKLGMGHFNGNGGAEGTWWSLPDTERWIRHHLERDPTYTAFLYYIDLPWSQVQYMGKSKRSYANRTVYPVTATYIEDPTKWNVSRAFQQQTPQSVS
jgi:hypothetical protein